eukprot:scaffold28313_cov52-Phaeocystis_antarctica.AAC.2
MLRRCRHETGCVRDGTATGALRVGACVQERGAAAAAAGLRRERVGHLLCVRANGRGCRKRNNVRLQCTILAERGEELRTIFAKCLTPGYG